MFSSVKRNECRYGQTFTIPYSNGYEQSKCSNCYSKTITTIISKWKVWLNRWLKKWTNRSNKNRSWRINRGGIFRKNTFISKNTPFKIGVLSEKTYNFAPSTDKK